MSEAFDRMDTPLGLERLFIRARRSACHQIRSTNIYDLAHSGRHAINQVLDGFVVDNAISRRQREAISRTVLICDEHDCGHRKRQTAQSRHQPLCQTNDDSEVTLLV
jgi:hypothetical protein